MTLQVPSPVTLQDAVETVISQNQSIRYNPARFIQITQGGYAANLVDVCNRLIQKGETFEALSPQVHRRPDTLTLEDLVAHSNHGGEWNLDESTVEVARARVEAWDREVGTPRWSPAPKS